MSKLVEKTPDVAMMIFDLCVHQDECFTHRSYGEMEVERRVSYSFFPFKRNNRKFVKRIANWFYDNMPLQRRIFAIFT